MAGRIKRGSEANTFIDANLEVGRKFVLPLKLVIPDSDEPGSLGLNGEGKLIYKDRNGETKEVANTGDTNDYKGYEHVQSEPLDTWIVRHNLGRKPTVIVTDTSGTIVIGETQYLDNNLVVVKFNHGFSGTVICN